MQKIRENIQQIKACTNKPIMLMLKANAYGFGLLEIGRATQDIVDMFGVVTVQEGIALRSANIQNDILVCACGVDEIESAVENNLVISLYNENILKTVLKLSKQKYAFKNALRVHLKLDTGMHRLGFCEGQIADVLKELNECAISVEGVFSHLRGNSFEQAQRFDCMLQNNAFDATVQYDRQKHIVKHLASSHSLHNDSMCYDMVRVGLCAYHGGMSLRSRVIATRTVESGEFVSYGNYKTTKRTNLATIFGGYADGLFGTKRVWINGRECPVVGDICMDMFIVDCGDVLPQIDDEVLIFDDKTVDIVARDRNVIEYMLYTSCVGRVQRIYVNDQARGTKNCKTEAQNNER